MLSESVQFVRAGHPSPRRPSCSFDATGLVHHCVAGLLFVGLVVWTVLDCLLVPVGQIHNRAIQHVLLAFLWLVAAIYLAGVRLDRVVHRSGLVHGLLAYGLVVGCHGVVRLSGDWDYTTAVTLGRHLFWIVIAITAMRLQRAGVLKAGLLTRLAQAVAVCVSLRLIASVFDGSVEAFEATGWAYWIAWLLPLLLLSGCSNPCDTAVVVLAIAAMACTLKRGALLAVAVGQVGFFSAWYRVCPQRARRAVGLVMLSGAVAMATLVWRWGPLLGRLSDLQSLETAGSWRGTFYRIVLGQWYALDTMRQAFGAGFWAVPDLLDRVWARQYAHSDWIEILYDYGMTGGIVFAGLNLAILGLVHRAWRLRDKVLPALVMGVIVFVLRTLYSGCTFWPETVWFGLLLGYAAGRIEDQVKETAWEGVA